MTMAFVGKMCHDEYIMIDNTFRWLDVPAEVAARRLLGCELLYTVDGAMVQVRIVETEAYDQADEASHTFNGRSMRNDTMFRRAGYLYVYFTYGMHHCCNIVCGSEGEGSAVLIRAVEPLAGLEVIESRRGKQGKNATNGPGKVCAALGIDRRYNGHDLSQPPIQLVKKARLADSDVTITTRIGISKAVHELRRMYVTDSLYVSKK